MTITTIINMNIFQCMNILLAQALPQTYNNIVFYEAWSNVKVNNAIERTFVVFEKVDGEFVLIFVFFAVDHFLGGIVHLELVDSLQSYN